MVRSAAEVEGLVERGMASRATAATTMNKASSRSHAVLTLTIERRDHYQSNQESKDRGSRVVCGKLHLVDLAGSERIHETGSESSESNRSRLREGRRINSSLSALGNVIAALTRPTGASGGHIPYRDSKLTRMLQGSLGGNCQTTLIATISSADCSAAESLSTLNFASRAKQVKNVVRINEALDETGLLKRYEAEVRRLRACISRGDVGGGPDGDANDTVHRELTTLEAEKHQADRARARVCDELALSEQELAIEQADKERLQQRIEDLAGKLPTSGSPMLASLTVDSTGVDIGNENAETDGDERKLAKYRQTLERQRHVMIALTKRLHERDEAILELQRQVEQYDKLQHRLEACLDAQTEPFIKQQTQRQRKQQQAETQQSALAGSGQAVNVEALHRLEANLRNRYLDYRTGMNERLALQEEKLKGMRRQHDELQQRRQQQQQSHAEVESQPFNDPEQHQVELADYQKRIDRASQEERQSLTEAKQLQDQVAMAQKESALLLALLRGKVRTCVNSLSTAFAQEGGWAVAPRVAHDLAAFQRLVGKGVEALSL